MNIKNWSTTAANNNSTSPDGFPEGMAPSGVNDSCREMMAALRSQHENAEWIDYGYTLSYISATSFVLDGDRTTQFHAGRRVRAGVGTGNVFGTILSASYSTKTGVTISLDSGSLDSSLSSMAVGIVSATNTSFPNNVYQTINTNRINGPIATSVDTYTPLTSDNIAGSATAVGSIMPISGYIKNLTGQVETNTLSVGLIITLTKNGVDTSLTATITAGSTLVISNTTTKISFSAGDLLAWHITTASGTGTAGGFKMSSVIQNP